MPASPDSRHYWSYRTLLEDKKRCLIDLPTVDRNVVNSLKREGQDHRISQRAMDELKRHMQLDINTTWDPNRDKTPRHSYLADENRPHISQKDLAEEKKHCMTAMRQRAKPRPSPSPRDLEDSNSGIGFEAHGMKALMQPDKAGIELERRGLQQHDDSKSHQLLSSKIRTHATNLNQRTPRRCQSARELGFSGSRSGEDPAFKSYQGDYPHGLSSEASPEGGDDRTKLGRYRSQAYMAIDKRRHAANVDGGKERARSSDAAMRPISLSADADTSRYTSQKALALNKKQHTLTLDNTKGGDAFNTRMPRSPDSDGTIQQDLFTSHATLAYGKKGHVLSLNSARTLRRNRSEDGASSSGSGSGGCTIGKGISKLMLSHTQEDQVHSSQAQFDLKKRNHATSVHRAPKPPMSDCDSETSLNNADDVFREQRRVSHPHNSCKAFSLKKKYHCTEIHAKLDSAMNPKSKAKAFDVNPTILESQTQLERMKKGHVFEYNPSHRQKGEKKPVPVAPAPRNGQWTPQHL